MTQLKPREIRVFLSSTFKDMEFERNHLIKQVFPKVRAACLDRQVGFTEIDLRWGVTEEESKNGATVEICLKEIDRCRDFPPFFIGFLGERYGWAPVHDDLTAYWEKNKESSYASVIQQAVQRGISVTELEMELAVLQEGALEKIAGHALFLWRSSTFTHELYTLAKADNPALSELEFFDAGGNKLAALKQRISESGFLDRIPYTSIEQFGSAIETYLLAQLDHYFPADDIPSPLQRSQAAHAAFRFHRLQNYLPRPDVQQTLMTALSTRVETPSLGPVFFTGPSGHGKSAMMADLAQHLETYTDKNIQWRVIDHYVGADDSSNLDNWIERLLRILHPEIKGIVGDAIPEKVKDRREALSLWLTIASRQTEQASDQVSKSVRFVLILDALDQLTDAGRNLDLLKPEVIGPSAVVIASVALQTLAHVATESFQTEAAQPISLLPFTTSLRSCLIESTLNRYNKGLPQTLVNKLAQAPQSGSPLFLSLALEELRLDARHETLAKTLEDVLGASDAAALFLNAFLLDEDYSRPQQPNLAIRFMALLGAARAGLTEIELADLLAMETDPVAADTGKPRLPQREMSRLMAAFKPFLIDKGDRRAPMHRIFGEAALAYLGEESVRHQLYVYFRPGYGFDQGTFILRSAEEALHQTTCMAKNSEDDKALLGCDLTRQGVLPLFTYQDAEETTLAALNCFSFDEKTNLAEQWGKYVETTSMVDEKQLDDVASSYENFANWLRIKVGHLSSAKLILKPLATSCRNILGDKNSNTLRVLSNYAIVIGDLDDPEAIDIEKEIVDIRQRLFGAEDSSTLISMANLAYSYHQYGNYIRAKEIGEKVVSTRLKLFEAKDIATLGAMSVLSSTLTQLGEFSEAILLGEKVLSIRRQMFGLDSQQTLDSMVPLGNTLRQAGRLIESKEMIELALYSLKQKLGIEHPYVLETMGNLALTLFELGEFSRVISIREDVLRIRRKILGCEHSRTLGVMLSLCNSYLQADRRKDAEVLYDEFIDITEAILNQALKLNIDGKYKESKFLNERALKIFRNILGYDDEKTLAVTSNIAINLANIGDMNQALDLQRQVLEIRRQQPNNPELLLISMKHLSITFYKMKAFYAAKQLEEEIVSINRRIHGDESENVAESLDQLADTLDCLDDSSARQMRVDAERIRKNISTKQDPASQLREEADVIELTDIELPNENKMRLTEVLTAWLTQEEWDEKQKIDIEEQTSSTGFEYTVGDFSLKCWFEISEKTEVFKVLIYFLSTKVPIKQLEEVQKFIVATNVSTTLGSVHLLRDDRTIRYYNAINVEDAPFELAHISNMLNSGLRTMEDVLPRYMTICFGGKSAEEALA